jgi:hypothetical protein
MHSESACSLCFYVPPYPLPLSTPTDAFPTRLSGVQPQVLGMKPARMPWIWRWPGAPPLRTADRSSLVVLARQDREARVNSQVWEPKRMCPCTGSPMVVLLSAHIAHTRCRLSKKTLTRKVKGRPNHPASCIFVPECNSQQAQCNTTSRWKPVCVLMPSTRAYSCSRSSCLARTRSSMFCPWAGPSTRGFLHSAVFYNEIFLQRHT